MYLSSRISMSPRTTDQNIPSEVNLMAHFQQHASCQGPVRVERDIPSLILRHPLLHTIINIHRELAVLRTRHNFQDTPQRNSTSFPLDQPQRRRCNGVVSQGGETDDLGHLSHSTALSCACHDSTCLDWAIPRPFSASYKLLSSLPRRCLQHHRMYQASPRHPH
jgi:hypothetical protein